jgi:anti-sigma B factor antagonist
MEPMSSVLLVAREAATLEPVAVELAVAGLRTRAVATYEEAVAHAAARQYDVAIIEAEMPQRGGAELVERLKQVRPDMACIVVTPHPSREDALRALSAGALAYIVGPPHAEALAELVRERRRHALLATEDALAVRVEEREGEPLLFLQGDLDVVTAPLLQRRIDELLTAGYQRVLVDADSLGFCDSTGLRVLIGARRRLAERDGELQLLRTSGVLQRLLDLSGLAALLQSPPSTLTPRDPIVHPRV